MEPSTANRSERATESDGECVRESDGERVARGVVRGVAFRTPTLRDLGATAPYGHAGTFANIRDVVLHYANIRMPVATPDPHVAGTLDAHLTGFDVTGRLDSITTFLMTL